MTTALQFELTVVPGGHGADDYEDDEGIAYALRASSGGNLCGEILFNLKEGPVIWVRWIEVFEGWRRRGVATALVVEAERRFPAAMVDTGAL